jgi:ethanolamine utilization protein EutN
VENCTNALNNRSSLNWAIPPILLCLIESSAGCWTKWDWIEVIFGRVHGRAISTIKVDHIEGVPLLVVQPLNKKLEPVGGFEVAADVVEAGPGDLCVMVQSREAAMAMREEWFVPIDLAIVGIVDELDVRQGIDINLKTGLNRFT